MDSSIKELPEYPERTRNKGKEKEKQLQEEEAKVENGDPGTNANANATQEESVVYAAVFDGHNGSSVSTYLKAHLHTRVLEVERSHVGTIVDKYRKLGGYLRRYNGGILQGLVDEPARRDRKPPSEEEKKKKAAKMVKPWDLHQRIHTSFLEADLQIMEKDQE